MNGIQLRIRGLAKEMGLSLSEFAKKIGTHQSSLSRSLAEGNNVGDAMLNKILIAFNINKTWLLTGEGEMLSGSNVQTSEGNTGSGIVGNNVQGGGINNNHVNGGGISQNDEGVMHKLLDMLREKDAAIASKDAQIERLLDIILKERAHE